MSSPPSQPTITPASLFSLAIYNPSLGPTDETVSDQIVFFTSREPQTPNDRLRQVGLAQGVVELARGFNTTEDLSQIETERSRIVLREVEEGWWILAHIDFTRITSGQPEKIEYSSRDVSHPQLLLAQLLSAYYQYRFLHGTFGMNIQEMGRERFCRKLERYWLRWVRRWDVTPSGNPAVEVWGGVKMAQPRLGTTVREVLEAFVAQERAIEGGGLVDMIVGRFGKAENAEQGKNDSSTTAAPPEPLRLSSALPFSLWPVSSNPSPAPSRTQSPGRPPSLLPLSFTPEPEPIVAREITASDGCIFPGTGQMDPTAMRDITKWACNVYLWNEDKVARNSSRIKKGKRPRLAHVSSTQTLGSGAESSPSGLRGRESAESSPGFENGSSMAPIPDLVRPQSLIGAQRQTLENAVHITTAVSHAREGAIATSSSTATSTSSTSNGKLLNILTFGWAGGGSGGGNVGAASSGGNTAGTSHGRGRDHDSQHPVTTEASVESQPGSPKFRPDTKKNGPPRFLYGYTGDLEDDEDEAESGLNIDGLETSSSRAHRGKITEKVVWLLDNNSNGSPSKGRGEIGGDLEPEASGNFQRSSTDRTLQPSELKEFRMVVYLNSPFIFILIFKPKTARLSSPSFYRSLHLRLGPLRSSLVPSMPKASKPGNNSKPIVYDLLYDPLTFAISSSLPNIPSHPPYSDTHTPPLPWSRVDAIHIHNHILNIYADSERGRERKSRTTRGWWLAYSKLGSTKKEAILVWKSGERSKGGMDRLLGQSDSRGEIDGSTSSLGGILDTRRYFEGLLRGRG